MSNCSIWPINKTLLGVTTLGESGPMSGVNEEILRIPQSSSITEALTLDGLVSDLGYSLRGGSYPSAEIQSIYSADPAIYFLASKNDFFFNISPHLLFILKFLKRRNGFLGSLGI